MVHSPAPKWDAIGFDNHSHFWQLPHLPRWSCHSDVWREETQSEHRAAFGHLQLGRRSYRPVHALRFPLCVFSGGPERNGLRPSIFQPATRVPAHKCTPMLAALAIRQVSCSTASRPVLRMSRTHQPVRVKGRMRPLTQGSLDSVVVPLAGL